MHVTACAIDGRGGHPGVRELWQGDVSTARGAEDFRNRLQSVVDDLNKGDTTAPQIGFWNGMMSNVPGFMIAIEYLPSDEHPRRVVLTVDPETIGSSHGA